MGHNSAKLDPVSLFLNNEKLIRFSIRDWLAQAPYLEDDMIGEGRIALWRACLNFKPDKGYKFSTYAVSVIRRAVERNVFSYLNRQKRQATVLSYHAVIEGGDEYADFWLVDDSMDKVIDNIEAKVVIKKFSKTNREWWLSKVLGFTGDEIAEMLNIKPSTARLRVRRSNQRLQEKLKAVV